MIVKYSIKHIPSLGKYYPKVGKYYMQRNNHSKIIHLKEDYLVDYCDSFDTEQEAREYIDEYTSQQIVETIDAGLNENGKIDSTGFWIILGKMFG